MGGGASRRRRNAEAAKAAAGPVVTPSMSRRRRVLLGTPELLPFERVHPKNQFTAFPEARRPQCQCGTVFAGAELICSKCAKPRAEAPQMEEEDLVFGRVGIALANEFRKNALQISNSECLLGPHTIEMLGLGIKTGSVISNRLFKIAQIIRDISFDEGMEHAPLLSKDEPSLPRPDFLTCYELLALFSVVRAGSKDELLELIFCVFDADGDDAISVEDFQATVAGYLEMEALNGLEGADLATYRKVDSKDKTQAARRVAELAVSKYGELGVELTPPAPEPVVLSEGEDPKAEPDRKGKDASAAPAADKENPKDAKRKRGWCLCGGGSKTPDTKKKGATDDKGKPLLEENSDSDGSGYSSDDAAGGGRKQKKSSKPKAEASPKRKARVGCFGRKGSQKDSDSEEAPLKGKDKDKEDDSGIKTSDETEGGRKEREQSEKEAADKDKKDAKDAKDGKASAAKAKAAPKKSTGCCPVCRGKKKTPASNKPPPPLTFEQWRRWFDENFADVVFPEGRPSVSDTKLRGTEPNPPEAKLNSASSMLTRGGTLHEEAADAGGPAAAAAGGVREFRVDDDDDSAAESEPESVRQTRMRQAQAA